MTSAGEARRGRLLRSGRGGRGGALGSALAVGVAALAIAAAAACTARDDAGAGQVRIAAAASLRVALPELIEAFHAERPEVAVTVVHGASGHLYAQIVNGAPFDLFLSADTLLPERLEAQGLAGAGGPFVYAEGRLALIASRRSGIDVGEGEAALRSPAVRRLAIANPAHAPYGVAALEALERYGAAALQERLAIAESAAQAVQLVHAGAADLGLVPLALIASGPASGAPRWTIPQEAHAPIAQAGLALRRARDPGAAAALQAFLLTEAAREILTRHGFAPPPAAPVPPAPASPAAPAPVGD